MLFEGKKVKMRTFYILLLCGIITEVQCQYIGVLNDTEIFTPYSVIPVIPARTPTNSVSEIPGGIITGGTQTLTKDKSPYLLRDDLIIEKTGELVIEPGVEIRFSSMIGLTIRGILRAQGTPQEHIVFTSWSEPSSQLPTPTVRLVDGPSIHAGRLQIFHNNQWRSVCTNSRNWTRNDLETTCRQLGFQGGAWLSWFDRQAGHKSRLLLEEPKCRGTEISLLECNWSSRQMGAGVCDYHPDIGIHCLPYHATSSSVVYYWRGIRFEDARSDRTLIEENTLYITTSLSELNNVDIKYAGCGRDYNTTSAIHVEGVPPKMMDLSVLYSAYSGITVRNAQAPVIMNNCTIRNNRGYGVYINSSSGFNLLDECFITENWGDGIRYIHHDLDLNQRIDRKDIYDFCTLPITSSQTFPVEFTVEQTKYSSVRKDCRKYFVTAAGHVLTLHFIQLVTDRNDSSRIEVFDGLDSNDYLLASLSIKNGTKPQSVTTTGSAMFISFHSEPKVEMLAYMRLSVGYKKTYDLNVTGSTIADNYGRGIGIENMRSQLHVHKSSISNNNHVAGIHVLNGAGDINVTDTRIAFNVGDGINITYSGGNRNITRSSLSSNKGYGISLWLNDSMHSPYIAFNQTFVVSYSEIFKNDDIGVFVGNFCSKSFVNVSGNWFNDSVGNAIEIQSCWRQYGKPLHLQIGHNYFIHNSRVGVKISPALNLNGLIEYNYFTRNLFGCILVRNKLLEEFEVLPVKLKIEHNEFEYNNGIYVVNLGLSPYSDEQSLLFTKNFVRYNRIKEPFDFDNGIRLVARSRVSAPVVVSSSNVDIFRNILENKESVYEIGSHLEDQSKIINCTYNWLGSTEEKLIYSRLFHRKDRYNLAKIEFIPFLLHSSNPGDNRMYPTSYYIPQFQVAGTNTVGGEVEGLETLRPGEYVVERDISVRPGGKLTIQSGVTLRFPPSVGMMVAGRIEARGVGPNDIKLTIKEERVEMPENVTDSFPTQSTVPVRLLGGRTSQEGRLQVLINYQWGTVCNYGWTIINAALVCHQLGLALNPDDWYLERSEIPYAGTTEPVILSNVRCTEEDIDIIKCHSEKVTDFENSCGHENDVGLRCYETSWAGVRMGVLAEPSNLQYLTIEKAGLLDYATNSFKPALQIDFSRHAMESIRVVNNFQDGLGVIYSDLYSAGAANVVKNGEFNYNRGSGISFKQLGLKITGSNMENNKMAGIRHNPALTSQQQREIAGWFKPSPDAHNAYQKPYIPILLPSGSTSIFIDDGDTKYFVTQKLDSDFVNLKFHISCTPGRVIAIQLLNPIHNRSTEEIIIYDSLVIIKETIVWNLRRDLVLFPTVSSSYGIVIDYNSGASALGGAVLIMSSVKAPIQDIHNRIVKGPVPTLTVTNSKIKGNKYGIFASYYNRYLDELGNHYLRKSNETIELIGCDISYNSDHAVFVLAPFWDVHESNVSEVKIMINSSLITDNGYGIYQFSRDLRNSNNLFHWIFQDNTIERNAVGGFDVALPYVWQYNENFTHSLYFANNTWRNNKDFAFIVDGHYAQLNMTKNVFDGNQCKTGLISIRGMEKKMRIDENLIVNNGGEFMVDFRVDSQSEILGEVYAKFMRNTVKNNRFGIFNLNRGFFQLSDNPTYVVGFHGIQKVHINQNLFGGNSLDYDLVAGVRTAKINSVINVKENWWGTMDITEIKNRIFDFDDWNNYAVAEYRPYLMSDNFDASWSTTLDVPSPHDLNNLGGRLQESLTLYERDFPYIIRSDITVMPGVELKITAGVVMEFAPNVGILVLGTLYAQGYREKPIIMRPSLLKSNIEQNRIERHAPISMLTDSVRLCTDRNCTNTQLNYELGSLANNEGFLEYYNKTTLQWVPVCDDRFTERNAQVVCRELGFPSINVFFDYGPRVEYHPNSLSRIWSWPEPLQCKGDELRYEDCEIRLNGQRYGHRHECIWNGNFVFIHCGTSSLDEQLDYWGGVRFANGQFEQNLHESRLHDVVTHQTTYRKESVFEYVNVIGAGVLHNEKSPAVLSISRSPSIKNVNISNCAHHGITFLSPIDHTRLLFNKVQNTLGVGIMAVSLTGEGQSSDESSFTPLRSLNLPYHLFSVIDICDPDKVIMVEERVVVYHKYDNHPVNCVKIFNSMHRSKPFGFRLLQFNLFNSTGKPGRPDNIVLYDGDIYNVTSRIIGRIEVGDGQEKKFFQTQLPSLSVKLFANGASSNHGFIAEVVTLPISAIGFNRDVQHNISYSVISNNREGAVNYLSAGEVNPTVMIEWNQFKHNCVKLYGNFTTCHAAVDMDVQNTQNIYFRNNLVQFNEGGLSIKADSRGSATSLKGWIHNNLFADNTDNPALYVEGRQSSPYQEVTIYRNYFAHNIQRYRNTIVLKQVVSNFTYNYVHDNRGYHNLEVSGFEKVRLPIYQTTSHNGFYKNYAFDRDRRGTIIAGTAGQHYVDNVFFDPDNDYEIVTVNMTLAGFNSTQDIWKSRIDAKHNYWSYNETYAVTGRIWDRYDLPDLLEVDFKPFYMNNQSILDGKCPPSWNQVGDTCYIYIGAPMTFNDARTFCRSVNASVPYIMSNYLTLYQFLRKQQERHQYYDRVWVQHLDRINQCTVFAYQTIEVDNCISLNPFICEIDPRVMIDPLSWRDDVVAVAVIGTVGAALLLIALAAGFWYRKSRHRRVERLERRNSIRASLHSLRSVGLVSTNGGFSDMGYRRKPPTASQRSSPSLTKGSDYKKMNGSFDSIEKSQFNSSMEDNQSYDIYEAHNANMSSASNFGYPSSTDAMNQNFNLAYKNAGYRDNSNTVSRDDWRPASEYSRYSEPIDYVTNSSTLPLDASLATDSTLDDLKTGLDFDIPSQKTYTLSEYPEPPPPPPPLDDSFNQGDYPLLTPDRDSQYYDYRDPSSTANLLETDLDSELLQRPKSHAMLETNLDDLESYKHSPIRSKSEALLETNLDSYLPTEDARHFNRSISQPLETPL